MNHGNKPGRIVLIIGLVTLAAGLLVAFTVSAAASQILLFSSILLNTTGITLLRGGRRK